MKTLIGGGNFGDNPKTSNIIKKIGFEFLDSEIINGGNLENLPSTINSDLIIWMPNISNENIKQYPKKSIGNVLIVSKVMREGYTDIDAINRIFKMHGNAVIAIYNESNIFRFKLIDALGNVWYNGTDLELLCYGIKNIYDFTKSAIRCKTISTCSSRICRNTKNDSNINKFELSEFIDINKTLIKHIQNSCGERFFGNLSTRCSKLFPSTRNNGIYVSPRNIDKEYISIDDMIYCTNGFVDNEVYFAGDRKPSVDTPIQLKIYEHCPQINYLIHGHAFIDGVIETQKYFLCGDLREATEVIEIIGNNKFGTLNLKKHGFLIYSDTIDNLKCIIKNLTFSYRR
jgi:hypothetical protein